ncbi:MAG: hypothetical protein OEM97_06090, partial [Acidimicrobiia bacterium]|nr:hypothetical protein [Acidimicrobiia bacterium]
MANLETERPVGTSPGSSRITFHAGAFPWWLVALLGIISVMIALVVVNEDYQEAFRAIFPWPLIEEVELEEGVMQTQLILTRGIGMTLILTLGSFAASLPIGLLLALGRLSGSTPARTGPGRFLQGVASNVSTLYIEFVRGIPMLVFIFAIAFVLAPDFADL